MRILMIEDDSATAISVELMLRAEGFNVYTTDLGEEGVDLAKIYDYDLILLDLNLPDMSGLEVLRTLRVGKINTPIIILTGTTNVETKVKCFNGGCDDYMTKPFHKDELIVRIRAVIRRSRGHTQSVITTGNLVVNLDEKRVEVAGTRLHFTPKEYQILEALSLRRGVTLTKENLLNHLYGGMSEPDLKIIDVFICKLRKKIASINGGSHYIETVWGRGYVLRDTAAGDQARARPKFIGLRGAVYDAIAKSSDCLTFEEIRAIVGENHHEVHVRSVLSWLMAHEQIENVSNHQKAAYRCVSKDQLAA